MRLYDLGVESLGQKTEALKALAWPVNAWACFVPENLNPPLNIFEKLILSLIDKQIVRTRSDLKYVLIKEIGLNENLVENIVENCCEKHIDKRKKEDLRIKEESRKLLDAMVDGITLDMEPSDKMKKIYLFEDLITNTVIPCFNIEELPDEIEAKDFNEDDCVSLKYERKYNQPKTSSISNALYYWTRIQKEKRNFENPNDNQVDLESEPISDNIDVESELFELNEIDQATEKNIKQPNLKWLTIFDDEPTPLLVKGYIAFNPSNPTSVEIISPFGNDFNNWFMKIVNRYRLTDEDFSFALQAFVEEKTDVFKGKVAFDNDLDIQLFEDFPIICNDPKFSSLKKSIRDLAKVYARIKDGEDDEYSNFAKNLRTAIEVAFREAIVANPDVFRMRYDYCDPSTGYGKYKVAISQFVSANRLNDDIRRRFTNKEIWGNITHPKGTIDRGNPKDNAALLLLYANKNPNSDVCNFVLQYRNIFLELFDLVQVGNGDTHGNYGQNYTLQNIEQYYVQYENIVRAMYSHLIEGDNNG